MIGNDKNRKERAGKSWRMTRLVGERIITKHVSIKVV